MQSTKTEYSTKSLSTVVTSMAGTAVKLDCTTPTGGGQRNNGHGHGQQHLASLGGTYSKTSIGTGTGSITEPSTNVSVSNCSVVLVASTTPSHGCSGAINSLTHNSNVNNQKVKTEAFEMEEFTLSEKDSFL